MKVSFVDHHMQCVAWHRFTSFLVTHPKPLALDLHIFDKVPALLIFVSDY